MKTQIMISAMLATMFISASAFAQNIDPYNDGSKYAYGENVGWMNFKPATSGVSVHDRKVSGYVWQENIGWINLSPASYGGVTYDASWKCGGYAWGENVGWINFNPASGGGVRIDSAGNFSGWAWGENIGWIHFASTSPVAYKVRACVVGMDDLGHFVAQWLASGSGNPADLLADSKVDFKDFAIFASDWCSFCADNWQLK
jgi:hypothetical protein